MRGNAGGGGACCALVVLCNGGVWEHTGGGMEDSTRGVRGAPTGRGKCEAGGAGRVLPGGASAAAHGSGSPGAHYTRRAHQDHGVEVEPGEMEVGFQFLQNLGRTWMEEGGVLIDIGSVVVLACASESLCTAGGHT